MGIKIYLLACQSSTARLSLFREVIVVRDSSLCSFQLLPHCARCPGRLTRYTTPMGSQSCWLPAGVSEGRRGVTLVFLLLGSLPGCSSLHEGLGCISQNDWLILPSLWVPGLIPSSSSFGSANGDGSPLSRSLGHCTVPVTLSKPSPSFWNSPQMIEFNGAISLLLQQPYSF